MAKQEYHIGFIGLANSGKTVLITSLINHLKHHAPEKFRLGDGKAKIDTNTYKDVFPLISGWEMVQYSANRLNLAEGGWPDKTGKLARYVCRFHRTDRPEEQSVTIYDIPGERFADFLMYDRDYHEWSQFIWQELIQKHSKTYFKDYKAAVEAADTTPAKLVQTYKYAGWPA